MITHLLIANRGEIACRIMRTATALGIRTHAVYSDADRNALHVRSADGATHIGAAAASASYLDGQRIIEAALAVGADAIHPGYGFLSENADFARACDTAGIIFVGPPAAAMDAMASKSAAKALMQAAGVPVLPGYHGDDQDDATLTDAATECGYPLMLKASAGGGGKGMRIVERAEDFAASLVTVRREAKASFGDDRVLLERYLVNPRHVEIQIFGDQNGQHVHLFESDCSIQRRHQKVLEEAPAPSLSDATREAMGEAAVRAAAAIDYTGAGTVEFIMGSDESFYFLEMNTRLQVEHPVTEMITGQDLVAWQLQVAEGAPLPLQQTQLQVNGHAIEARFYAEDTDNGFLPASGHLYHVGFPAPSASLRIETGVESGDEVSVHYDPMIAKIVAWGIDRNAAIRALQAALAQTSVIGPVNNLSFVAQLLAHPAFIATEVHTGFIEQHAESLGINETTIASEYQQALMLAASYSFLHPAAQAEPSDRRTLAANWRLRNQHQQLAFWETNGQQSLVDVAQVSGGHEQPRQLRVNLRDSIAAEADSTHTCGVEVLRCEPGQLQVSIDNQLITARITAAASAAGRLLVQVPATGLNRTVTQLPIEALCDASQQAEGSLLAPMPGKVISVTVSAGEQVEAGQALMVLEAMKMEHTIRAPHAGIVSEIHFAAEALVPEQALLLVIEE